MRNKKKKKSRKKFNFSFVRFFQYETLLYIQVNSLLSRLKSNNQCQTIS